MDANDLEIWYVETFYNDSLYFLRVYQTDGDLNEIPDTEEFEIRDRSKPIPSLEAIVNMIDPKDPKNLRLAHYPFSFTKRFQVLVDAHIDKMKNRHEEQH